MEAYSLATRQTGIQASERAAHGTDDDAVAMCPAAALFNRSLVLGRTGF